MKKRIVILGAGESGVGSALLAQQKGMEVFISDLGEIKPQYKTLLLEHQIPFEEKQHSQDLILNAQEVIKSPGIPEKADIIKKLRAKAIPIISEIEFAARYTSAKMIAITGSNGKTTTTLLTYHILQKAGLNVGLAGNVGTSLALQVARENYDYYVLELSSFQLDDMFDFRADIAVLTNITPDHLDRYNYEFQNYINSKFRIIQNQTSNDSFIFGFDDKVIENDLKKRDLVMNSYPFSIQTALQQGVSMESDIIKFCIDNQNFTLPLSNLSLKGKHNIYNSMAAATVALRLGVDWQIIQAGLADFQGVEHRLEFVESVKGIDFINDSKATNIDSAWYALDSMTKPTIWIVGGTDKGNDYSVLLDLVKQKVKAIVCMGLDNSKIIKAFEGILPMLDTHSVQEAVSQSFGLAENGDCVLLSPCCASFDLFQNYEDRGRKFKAEVRNL